MQITVEEKGSTLVIKLAGHLGHASVAELGHVIDEWLGKNRQNFIVDMEKLQYISSAGLRCLLEAGSKIDKLKGKMLLCALQPEVKQIFDVSGFTSLFAICATVPKALKQI